jgi:hypothetical protein
VDEKKYHELNKKYEKLNAEHRKVLKALKLLKKKSEILTFMIEKLHESQEERLSKHDELIEEFCFQQDQQLKEMQSALEEFLETD